MFSKETLLDCVEDSVVGNEGDLFIVIGGLDVNDHSNTPCTFEALIKWLEK